jgi:hypothetical protein
VQTADQRKQSRAEHGNRGGCGEEQRKKREEEQSRIAAKEGGREDIPASRAEQSRSRRTEWESRSRVTDGATSQTGRSRGAELRSRTERSAVEPSREESCGRADSRGQAWLAQGSRCASTGAAAGFRCAAAFSSLPLSFLSLSLSLSQLN